VIENFYCAGAHNEEEKCDKPKPTPKGTTPEPIVIIGLCKK